MNISCSCLLLREWGCLDASKNHELRCRRFPPLIGSFRRQPHIKSPPLRTLYTTNNISKNNSSTTRTENGSPNPSSHHIPPHLAIRRPTQSTRHPLRTLPRTPHHPPTHPLLQPTLPIIRRSDRHNPHQTISPVRNE